MTETRTSSKQLILISFILFLSVLLGLFSIQMKNALDGFDRWVGHEDHRLPNIRLVPEKCRWAVIDRFIELQPVDEADAFIFGDSQMFARGAKQEELFYTEWLGEEATVINFSFLAARISDMRKIADDLHSRNVEVPRLLQNLNISHFTVLEDNIVPGEITETKNPKASFLPNRPNAVESLIDNKMTCAFHMRKTLSEDSLRTPRYRKLLSTYKKVNLPTFFVSFDKDIFNEDVPPHIDSFKAISKQPIFITAPMAYDKFELYNFENKNLDNFAAAFEKLCAKHPEIDCHDLTRSITSKGFMDLIHMNAQGHKMLSEELKRSVPNK